MSILPGACLLCFTFIFNRTLLVRWQKECYRLGRQQVSSVFMQFLMLSLVSGGLCFLVDAFLFYFIDSSVSEHFAESLMEFMMQNGQDTEGIAGFAQIPFLVQNIFVFIFFVLLSNAITVFIAGKMFNTFKHEQEMEVAG